MANSFNGIESLGQFTENYSSNLTAVTAIISNLSSQIINGGTNYLFYDGTEASPTATASINSTINFINNTSGGSNVLNITLTEGINEGQILIFAPLSASFTISGGNINPSSIGTRSTGIAYVWSNTFNVWIQIAQV